MEAVLSWFIEPLSLPFMQRALVGAMGVAVLCAVVGTFVVLLGLAFIGEGVSHGSLAGLALGFLLKLDLLLVSLPFGVGLALLIGYLAERTRTRFDAAVGVVFATSAAMGIALISAVRTFPDLNSYLFGNVLAIRPLDLALLGVAALRHEGKLEYDPDKMRITNNVEANKLLKPVFRKGWEFHAVKG